MPSRSWLFAALALVIAWFLYATPWLFGGLVVLLALAMSVVSFYYYLKVLKQVYVSEPSTDAAITVQVTTRIALWITAALVVFLGCLPNLLLDQIATVLH